MKPIKKNYVFGNIIIDTILSLILFSLQKLMGTWRMIYYKKI